MINRKLIILACIFCFPSALSADIVSASHVIPVPNNGAAIFSTLWRGQSFTPLVSGQLTTVELQLGHSEGEMPTADLVIEIMKLAGGLPDESAILGTKTIIESLIPEDNFPDALVSVDFSDQAINLVAGQQLVIVARSATGAFPDWYLWGSESSTGTYAGGEAFSRITGTWSTLSTTDSGFRISVAGVPEPSSLLFLAGVAGVAFARFRRKR